MGIFNPIVFPTHYLKDLLNLIKKYQNSSQNKQISKIGTLKLENYNGVE